MVSVHSAQDAIEIAKADGWDEGRAEGIEENKRENALRMKTDGMTPDLIAKYTGLTVEAVNSL